jgi:hypothetical protein
MVFGLVALSLQLSADSLSELAHSLLPYIPLDLPNLRTVLTDAGPFLEAAAGASAHKLVGLHVLASFSSFSFGASCHSMKS